MVTKRSHWLVGFGTALLLLGLQACAEGSAGQAGEGGSGPGGIPGTGGVGGTGGSGASGPGCETAADCPSGSVCDPATQTCRPSTACRDSTECGPGAICDAQGQCRANETGGVCVAEEDCPAGDLCIHGRCGCRGDRYEAEMIQPNVLILLDKSGSMGDRVGSDTKWRIAIRALERLLADFGDQIRFGLVLYPEGGGCDPGRILVEVGPDNASEILATLDDYSPRGSTPIGGSLEAVTGHPSLQDPSRPNYILLLTDGEERCGGDGEAAVSALRTLDPEVKTFVVGFGDGVEAGDLDAMAVAGGTALAGSPKYYQADDEASLTAAFSAIGGMVLTCAYEIRDNGLALEPKDIHVFFDGVEVPHDPTSGWDYVRGSSQIVFRGASCDALRGGSVSDLVIVHACPVPID